MLLYISDYLIEFDSSFAIFQYLTLRAILAALTALLLSFMVGPMMIRKLAKYKVEQAIRSDGPKSHLVKAGTPTMGGALILGPSLRIACSTLYLANFLIIIGPTINERSKAVSAAKIGRASCRERV